MGLRLDSGTLRSVEDVTVVKTRQEEKGTGDRCSPTSATGNSFLLCFIYCASTQDCIHTRALLLKKKKEGDGGKRKEGC